MLVVYSVAVQVSRNISLRPNGDGSWTCLDSATGVSARLSADAVVLLASIAAGRVLISAGQSNGGVMRSQLGVLQAAGIVQPVEGSEEDRAALPAFIIGSYRSGTTLLRYIVDAHPALACPPESKFLSGIDALLDYPEAIDALVLMGLDKEDIRYGLRLFIESCLSGYAARAGKRRWVDKTPNYHRLLSLIDAIFDSRVLYIFLVRHPLDTIDSLEHFFRESAFHPDPDVAAKVAKFGKGSYGWAQFWVEVYERAAAFRAEHPDRSYLLRYEDLVRDPQTEAKRMFTFLGEDCPPGIAEEAFRLPHTPGIQDPKIGTTNRVHSESVGKWRNWPRNRLEALWPIVERTATVYGYISPFQ